MLVIFNFCAFVSLLHFACLTKTINMPWLCKQQLGTLQETIKWVSGAAPLPLAEPRLPDSPRTPRGTLFLPLVTTTLCDHKLVALTLLRSLHWLSLPAPCVWRHIYTELPALSSQGHLQIPKILVAKISIKEKKKVPGQDLLVLLKKWKWEWPLLYH